MCIISHCNSPCLKVVPTISWTRKSRACRLFYSCLALMTSSVGTQFSIKGGYWVLESTYFLSHNILYTLHPSHPSTVFSCFSLLLVLSCQHCKSHFCFQNQPSFSVCPLSSSWLLPSEPEPGSTLTQFFILISKVFQIHVQNIQCKYSMQ